MTAPSNHHALVIGASGVIGWSVVNQLLQPYPSSTPFKKITALTNRPLKLEDSFWPDNAPSRPALSLVSGINLHCDDDEFAESLEKKVADVASVTHVYYSGELVVNTRLKGRETHS
jgi:nucleoside-diphosphate-sugar epimerase